MKLWRDLKHNHFTSLLSLPHLHLCTSIDVNGKWGKKRKPFTNAVRMQVGLIIIQNDPESKPEIFFEHF